jgi:hypothetical protein
MPGSLLWGHTPAKYLTANAPLFWHVAHEDLTVDATNGYGGGPALAGSSLDAYAIRDVRGITQPTVFGVGDRFKVGSYPASPKILLGVTGQDRALRVCVALLPDGTLAVYRGALEQLLAEPTAAAVGTGSQLRLGLKGVLGAGVGGSFELHLGGVAVRVATGVDTGDVSWRGVYVGPGPAIYHSHLYAGDSGVLWPGALCGVTNVNNADLDDADPDGDTTRETLDVDDQVSEPLVTPTSRRTILLFGSVAVAKQNIETGAIAHILTLNGVPYVGDRQPLTNAYAATEDFRPTNPETGSPFQGAELTDADTELGVEVQE